jgi:hypothetical protein
MAWRPAAQALIMTAFHDHPLVRLVVVDMIEYIARSWVVPPRRVWYSRLPRLVAVAVASSTTDSTGAAKALVKCEPTMYETILRVQRSPQGLVNWCHDRGGRHQGLGLRNHSSRGRRWSFPLPVQKSRIQDRAYLRKELHLLKRQSSLPC